MIEVKLQLYTPWEMQVITEGMSIIQQARAQQLAPQEPAPRVVEVEAVEVASPTVEVRGQVVGHIGQAVEPEAAPSVTVEQIEAAAAAHLKIHGLVSAQQIVAQYGASQIKKVDPALWPAMLAAFGSAQ